MTIVFQDCASIQFLHKSLDLTYRYPRTQQRSARRPSRSRRKAGACSWPCRCAPACRATVSTSTSNSPIVRLRRFDVLDNVRTDGRSEDIGQGLSGPGGLALSRGDSDGRARRHCCRLSMVRLETKFPSRASPVDFFAYCGSWAEALSPRYFVWTSASVDV